MAQTERQTIPAVISDPAQLRSYVDRAVSECPITDMHTHLFPPEFGELCLWGIDELLTYHYLVAELFRFSSATPEEFWALSKSQQADLIWKTLFVDNTPLSEATRGVTTVLSKFGLDPAATNLDQARRYFASQDLASHVEQVLKLANVTDVVMTNDPFDPQERAAWKPQAHSRFHAALRLDSLLHGWSDSYRVLELQGYAVSEMLTPTTIAEARRFLDVQIERMRPLYSAASFRYDFTYGGDSTGERLLREVILPTLAEHGIPFALMIGVARGVNPALKGGGDGLGRADVRQIERVCLENPNVRFLVTMLSRENQHELCVSARKFSNLMPFGCWWFLNNPSVIAEITAERLEMLGASFIPQHSDARILEQVIYKWSHSRHVIAGCLADSYLALVRNCYPLTPEQIDRDVKRLFSGNFRDWVRMAS